METPVIELIAENIKVALAEITEAAGFNQTLHPVRPKRSDFEQTSWDDLTVLISQTEAEDQKAEMGFKGWRQYFILTAIVIDAKTVQTPIDTRLNRVTADIVKKLYADTRRNDLAYDTNIHSAVPFIDEETAMSGIAIQISVDYRTKEDDPYTAA